ncbi:MAG: tRNA (N6-isopentenyl adenosine(37)-C2)-methylthiotransferase MiaB [bacterium]|jgi:tRNA-2-methylthio-N6-dimethylallyladenosine synthase
MEKTYFIETFGCQMNVYDSEFIADLLSMRGYSTAGSPEDASLVLINTCSVRARAERKAITRAQEIAALKRTGKPLYLGIIGCMAQRLGGDLEKAGCRADFILGPDTYLDLPGIIDGLESRNAPGNRSGTPGKLKRGAGGAHVDTGQDPGCLYSLKPETHEAVTAFVTIMRGCNNFCSFCIVPYVRGRERSKPVAEVIAEVEHMVSLGVKEVTLLGQNVNSYADDGLDFAGLLARVNAVEGLRRIRFTTSHPRDLTAEVIDAIAGLDKVCEHLHLPLQSGSDRILRAMNRGYTYAGYRDKVALARSRVPGISVTTDLMVGFPSEDDADHQATLEAVRELRFESAFTFNYSPRPGTRASKLKDDVPDSEKSRRLQEILEIENGVIDSCKGALDGEEVEILVEAESKREPGYMTGRTRKNWLAKLPGKGVRRGEVVAARVTGVSRWMITCDEYSRKVGA